MAFMVTMKMSKRAVARQQRLASYPGEGVPPADKACELLCEDHVGTYALPYLCYWSGTWRSLQTGERVKAGVVGWRVAGLA
jgi:hypothetical protein